MAQKLADILTPLVDELAYIFGPHANKISFSFDLHTDCTKTAVTNLHLFCLSNLKNKDKMAIKRRLLKHSFRKDSCIKSLTMTENRITVAICDHSKWSKIFLMEDVFSSSKLRYPFDNSYFSVAAKKSFLKTDKTKETAL